MGMEARTDNYSLDFIREGSAKTKSNETVVQDGGRTGDMEKYTVMCFDPATGKWSSLIDETATDGTAYPRGILMATLTEAEIQAGDVEDVPIMVGGPAIVDANQLVFEAAIALDTVIDVPTNTNTTVEIELGKLGIYVEVTRDVDGFENA